MKVLSITFSLLALAMSAGCAQQQPRTSAMGASPTTASQNFYCRDGAYVSSGGCGSHGGVERDMGTGTKQ
jgi:uncharacterized lipoprotein YajG